LFLPLLDVAAVQHVGRGVYRRVAGHRARSCNLPVASVRPPSLS
jgi:hypothetical protein